jgi:hypothetical protein
MQFFGVCHCTCGFSLEGSFSVSFSVGVLMRNIWLFLVRVGVEGAGILRLCRSPWVLGLQLERRVIFHLSGDSPVKGGIC